MPPTPEILTQDAAWTAIWSSIAAGIAGLGTWAKMRQTTPPEEHADSLRETVVRAAADVTRLLDLVSERDEGGSVKLREPRYHGEAMRSIAASLSQLTSTADATREILTLMRSDLRSIHGRLDELETEVEELGGRRRRTVREPRDGNS